MCSHENDDLLIKI